MSTLSCFCCMFQFFFCFVFVFFLLYSKTTERFSSVFYCSRWALLPLGFLNRPHYGLYSVNETNKKEKKNDENKKNRNKINIQGQSNSKWKQWPNYKRVLWENNRTANGKLVGRQNRQRSASLR